MFLPNRLVLSKKSSNKLQMIKQHTSITPNILSRVAIMLAINSNDDISNAGVEDAKGQSLDKDTLFGDSIDAYEVMIRQYMHENKIELPVKVVIPSLIEIGVHKMGHVRSLEQLCALK
jgi:DNA sulfur modification protein DndE